MGRGGGRLVAAGRRGWHAFDGLAVDTLWSGAHDGTQLVAAFASVYFLLRALEPADYGAYVGLYALVGTFGAVSYAGVGLALLQRLVGEGDPPSETLRSFLSVALIVGLVASGVGVMAGVAVLPLSLFEVAMIVVAELLGASMAFVSALAVQAASGFGAATRVKLGVIVLRFGVLMVLVVLDRLTIAALAGGFALSFGLYAVYLVGHHLPRHGYRVAVGWPSGQAWRSSFLFAAPMGASRLQTDGDKFLLNAFGFGFEAGLYGAAYRLILLGTTPLLALDTAAFQRFLPRGEGQRGLHWRRATRLGALMGAAAVVVAAGIYLILPLFAFLFEGEFRPALDIVPWLLVLIPLVATTNSPMNGLLGLGRAGVRMVLYLVGAALSLALYLVLIPRFGWEGALAATVVGEVGLSIGAWVALWHYQGRADRARPASDQTVAAAP